MLGVVMEWILAKKKKLNLISHQAVISRKAAKPCLRQGTLGRKRISIYCALANSLPAGRQVGGLACNSDANERWTLSLQCNNQVCFERNWCSKVD